MDVAEGNSGAGNSGGGQPGEGTNNGPRGSGAGQGSEENSFTEPQNSTSKEDKPTEEVHGTGHDHVEASKNPQAAGQIMYMASSQSKGVMIEHEVSGTGIKGNGGDMQGKNVTAKSPKTNHKHGNSSTNLNRSTNKPNDATYKPDIIACDLSPHAALVASYLYHWNHRICQIVGVTSIIEVTWEHWQPLLGQFLREVNDGRVHQMKTQVPVLSALKPRETWMVLLHYTQIPS
jgi:hypothetical protein